MKKILVRTLEITFIAILIFGCSKNDSSNETAWDESVNGELSGDMSNPTSLNFNEGNNRIIATSIPGAEAECTTFVGGPPDPIIPYFPVHESYTDVFTFTIPEGKKLISILVESLEVTPVHTFEDYPCVGSLEGQAGAFTSMNNSNQIDWNSDNVINFISLPVNHPLIGMGFAKAAGEDLLEKYKGDFPLPGYEGINSPSLIVNAGTYTFWWKEGANRASYTLNFVVE